MTLNYTAANNPPPPGRSAPINRSLRTGSDSATAAPPLSHQNPQPAAQDAQTFEKRAKPADRLPTARLDDIIPTESPFWELQEWERTVDEHILRKQMRIADAAFKGPKIKRTLRIVVYNLAHDQPDLSGAKPPTAAVTGPYALLQQPGNEVEDENQGDLLKSAAETAAANAVPSWTLRIEGRLEVKAGRPSVAATRKFSSFLRSILVQISDDDIVEWHRRPGISTTDVDGFEIKRRGDQPRSVKIIIVLENQPERLKLSPALADLLPSVAPAATRPHIIMALWRYVKLNKLQESDEKKVINCDAALSALFNGAQRCTFSELPALVEPHLSPPDPIVINYDIRLDTPLSLGPLAYDIDVDIDDNARLGRSLTNTPLLYNLQMDLDTTTLRLRELTETLRATVHNQRLLSEFAADPVGFIRRTYQQQCDDISALIGDSRSKVNTGDLFRAERYERDDVRMAVAELVGEMGEINLH